MVNITGAHQFSSNHRKELEVSQKCGCFFCLKIFDSSEIKKFYVRDPGGTALCPYCGIDSVIGESSGFVITEDFLETMQHRWFW